MAEYKVKFEVFEGPLDLLLYLIKKEEVDITRSTSPSWPRSSSNTSTSCACWTSKSPANSWSWPPRSCTSRAANCCRWISRSQVEGEEDGEDPRWELIRQLVEYKKFKDAAAQLQELEIAPGKRLPAPAAANPSSNAGRPAPSRTSPFSTSINAVNTILKRVNQREGESRDIFEDKWTVSEKIEHLIDHDHASGRG